MNSLKAIFLICLFLIGLFMFMAVSITVQSGELDGKANYRPTKVQSNSVGYDFDVEKVT